MKVELDSPEMTLSFAKKMGELADVGNIIFLIGDLGAGKTTFTKGFAQGLGITQMVKSPSYTIIREYENGRLPLYHMDLYRLEGHNDDLGLDEYFEGDGVSVVEWANLLEDLPEDYLTLTFEKIDESSRELTLKATGKKSHHYLERIEGVPWI